MRDELTYQTLNLYSNYKEASEQYPNKEIILDEKMSSFPELPLETTYSETHDNILKRAYQLAELGIQKNDKVILYKSPKFDTYLLAVAVSFLGAIPVMVSYHLPSKTIEVFVDRLKQPFIIYDDETAERVKQVFNSTTDHKLSVDKILEQNYTIVSQQYLSVDEIAYMTHTSGTTGIPKLICHSQQSMGWRTKWQKTILSMMKERGLAGFHISPVHSRFNIGVSSLMTMGFPLMPIAKSDKETVSRMLTKYQPIALETHPNNFVQWSSLAQKQPDVFASISYYHSTFDAINNETMARFLRASEKNQPIFLQVYGQSECGPMVLKSHTLQSLRQSNARDMGVGLMGLTEARIVDAVGNILPVGTNGNIHFLSKGRALTYYGEDERFQENVFGSWWDSGDYGCMDKNRHLYLKDRQVDLIHKIDSNLAIEDVLLDNLPFLEEVVIVRDSEGHPQPIAAVIPGLEMDWDAWWMVVEDLPHLNEPIIKAFDEIPHTATMKVQRLQIERELNDRTF
ncbi:AMP-binding protein [Vagococcus vulneris]|uniref:Acetate--CoA ligase n=1 Tax=Vagococcus vulneris TaxID=1977869 RepID=A0A429ZZ84_9ENTE|nr:acyl-CoA synthetase [Vagococcus vulneris]RST99329.1 acetate--CoA ligase [Vagococcus vulneris]